MEEEIQEHFMDQGMFDNSFSVLTEIFVFSAFQRGTVGVFFLTNNNIFV